MALALGVGCGGQKPATPGPAASLPAVVTANILAVDLEGHPLAGMMPIATLQANAFDKPSAQGELTKEDGKGSVAIPPDQKVYVRAWDPTLKRFANNYYEIHPGAEMNPEAMTVAMVPGASLEASLLTPDGKPAAEMNVSLMMFHPTEGPWWPAETKADKRGAVRFPSVPAGDFHIRIKVPTGAQAAISNVMLPPGGGTNLGLIRLQMRDAA